MSERAPRLLFFVTEDWYFCSHRLPLAQAAQAAGYEVALITRIRDQGESIRAQGIRVISLELSRRGLNPLRELALIVRLYAIYRRERPDILHQVAMKPVLYGSLVARLAGAPRIVNALAGLGFLFSSQRLQARLLRPFVRLALRGLLDDTQVIVQNPDDARLLNELARLTPQQVQIIRGSGVDLTSFRPTPPPSESPAGPVIMLPARLLWDKGVGELVEAAKRLRARKIAARCVLVGMPDPDNPTAVPEERIHAWVQAGFIEWWGHQDDMPTTLSQSHIVCLPSYREGLPKVLAEAAACGRPIVTSDAPGCREVVRHGENGLLVPIGDANALAEALVTLIRNPELRAAYGSAGRQRAEAEFGNAKVIAATLALYQRLLDEH